MKLAPSLGWKVGFTALLIFLALLMAAYVPWDRPVGGWSGQQWLALLLSAGSLLGAVTYPSKAVVLEGDSIRENLWFVWRKRPLPPRVTVWRRADGRVLVADAADGRLLLAPLAREFGPSRTVEGRLKAWLRKHDRLEAEVEN